jgi:diguanylate cyclase (GGDEF)-like protein
MVAFAPFRSSPGSALQKSGKPMNSNNNALVTALRNLSSARDVDSLQSSLLSTLCDACGAASAIMWPWRDETGTESTDGAVAFGPDGAAGDEAFAAVLAGLDGDEYRACLRMNKAGEFRLGEQVICRVFPLFHSEKKRGVITLHFDSTPTVDLFALCDLFAIIDDFHAILYAGEHDQLTGLLNRRTFEAKLGLLLREQRQRALATGQADSEQTRRQGIEAGCSAWLAIADIDRFKRINDSYGHLIGDEVILLLARALRRGFRDNDLIFRFGGEEFVVVLAPTRDEHAEMVLDRLRRNVEQTVFPMVGGVTISIGFTRIVDADNSRSALDRADQALYFAKDAGRNRVESFERLLSLGQIQGSDKSGEIELF